MKTLLEKKFSEILNDAKVYYGTYPNLTVTITNLCSRLLRKDEYETPQYSLKHGIVIKSKSKYNNVAL